MTQITVRNQKLTFKDYKKIRESKILQEFEDIPIPEVVESPPEEIKEKRQKKNSKKRERKPKNSLKLNEYAPDGRNARKSLF